MRRAHAFPPPAHIIQRTLVRAAIDIVPDPIREAIGLSARYGLRPFERSLVERLARRGERYRLRSSPAAQACRRLGLARGLSLSVIEFGDGEICPAPTTALRKREYTLSWDFPDANHA